MKLWLLTYTWEVSHAQFYQMEVNKFFSIYWPSTNEAEDLIEALMGCPL
jgi:hypothetical protein